MMWSILDDLCIIEREAASRYESALKALDRCNADLDQGASFTVRAGAISAACLMVAEGDSIRAMKLSRYFLATYKPERKGWSWKSGALLLLACKQDAHRRSSVFI